MLIPKMVEKEKVGLYETKYDIDEQVKKIIKDIIVNGTWDDNPRAKYKDCHSAYTKSINHAIISFDIGEEYLLPIISLRPVAWKSAIGEILWIYQDESNDLELLKDKYGVTWWDNWKLKDNTIGCCYGETVRRHNLMKNLLWGLKNNPFGRRHIMNLWQEDDFKLPHSLKPCCYQTVWNMRKNDDGKLYLDMCLFQRSCDFLVAASTTNLIQYAALQIFVAKHLNVIPGKFTWFGANVHIYDRHLNIAEDLLNRESIIMYPKLKFNTKINNFYHIDINDISIEGYPKDKISEINPQVKFDMAI